MNTYTDSFLAKFPTLLYDVCLCLFVSSCLFQFCATRKGTQQAAATLVKDARFVVNVQHKQKLLQVANSLRDSKLRGLCNMKAPQVSLNIETQKS